MGSSYYQPLIRVKVESGDTYSNTFTISGVDDVMLLPPSTLPDDVVLIIEFKIEEDGFDWREFNGAMRLYTTGYNLSDMKTLFHPDISFRLKLVEENPDAEVYLDHTSTSDYTFILSGV